MAALHQLEFFLLRYSGDATKRESINLGVVAIAPENGAPGGFADVRFIRNWRRLHCFDPLADVEELQAIEREIRRDLQDPKARAELLKRFSDTHSNSIRLDQLRGCLTASPVKELERLSSIYLETPGATEKRELGGRQRILQIMRGELGKAGILGNMIPDVPMSTYTKPGDPLKLDFGYPRGEGFKFLHAVALAQRVEHGMTLAARFPQIAAGMREKAQANAWLTAVVEDDLPERNEVTFALGMLEDNGIRVARVAEMPQIAEEIRVELAGI
jgi:DUF3037 family protein